MSGIRLIAGLGNIGPEYDDTPSDFGRIAAMTAKQVLVQRLRDEDSDRTFVEFSAKEGDLVSGVVQQGNDPKMIRSPEALAQIRQQRAQANADAQRAAMAQQLSQSAKNLAGADTSGQNALTAMLGGQ